MKPTDFKPGEVVDYFRAKNTGRGYDKYTATVVQVNPKTVWIAVPEFIKLIRTPAENLQKRGES